MKQEWRDEERMMKENSFGTVPGSESTTTMITIMTINEERRRGSFEWYDWVTSGDEYYCEGGLWFSEDMILNDFDGNYDLPPRVVQYLYDNDMLDESDISMWKENGKIQEEE